MAEFDVEVFLSEELSNRLVKANLKSVANKLGVDLTGCTQKKDILNAIAEHKGLSNPDPAASAAHSSELTEDANDSSDKQNESDSDELKAEFAKVELEERRDRLKAAEHEREMERKRLEFEMMRYEEMNAQARTSMQSDRGKSEGNEFAARLKLVPKFDENDLDSFFLTFERIASKMKWPEDEWAFFIPQVITGKAQSVVSALGNEH